MKADPDKVKAITDFPILRDKRQLQAFLGMCGYYLRFSARHPNFVEPFRNLLQSGAAWAWDSSHSRAFEKLMRNFNDCVTLGHYLPDAPFRLQTNA